MWYSLILIFAVTLTGVQAQPQKDLEALKRDTQIFEQIVNEVLRQNFSNPFAVTEAPQGAYLSGYGVVVSFQLNINRASMRTPWGEMPAPRTVARRNKEEQLQDVKEALIRCLADYGNTFRQLNGTDRISITGHIQDRNEIDPEKRRTVLVLSVSKEDVESFVTRRISFENLRERIRIVTY